MILCINPYDTLEYIKQTIAAAESLTDGKVIAIVCFPNDIDENWSVLKVNKKRIHPEKVESLKASIKRETNINMYILDDELDLDGIIEEIIAFFNGNA